VPEVPSSPRRSLNPLSTPTSSSATIFHFFFFIFINYLFYFILLLLLAELSKKRSDRRLSINQETTELWNRTNSAPVPVISSPGTTAHAPPHTHHFTTVTRWVLADAQGACVGPPSRRRTHRAPTVRWPRNGRRTLLARPLRYTHAYTHAQHNTKCAEFIADGLSSGQGGHQEPARGVPGQEGPNHEHLRRRTTTPHQFPFSTCFAH
jgi:hypothetical protein